MVEDVPGLLGVLLGLRNLMPLMCDASLTAPDTAFQLKGSFGAKVTETDTHIDIVLVLRVNLFICTYSMICSVKVAYIDPRNSYNCLMEQCNIIAPVFIVINCVTSNTVNFTCEAETHDLWGHLPCKQVTPRNVFFGD